MAAQWKPGDVGVRPHGGERSIAVEYDHGSCVDGHSRELHWHNRTGGWDYIGSVRRPLAVLDPESTEDATRLARLYEKAKADHPDTRTFNMQRALRTYASPEPEIEEPRGLGAVVEDADGALWVRTDAGEFNKPWYRGDTIGLHSHWSRVKAGRILSPGVEGS